MEHPDILLFCAEYTVAFADIFILFSAIVLLFAGFKPIEVSVANVFKEKVGSPARFPHFSVG